MKLCVLADDLTGANDSGVKLSKKGVKSTVLFNLNEEKLDDINPAIYNTDSRHLSKEKAYKSIYNSAKFFKNYGFDVIYKKIDSTLRGNIGAELDAVYDVYQPDFVIVAPAMPKNGRTMENGVIHCDGIRLEEANVFNVSYEKNIESDITKVMDKQSKYFSKLVTGKDLQKGASHIKGILEECAKNNTTYILIDSYKENDLIKISKYIYETKYNIIWAGSSGLINYLPYFSNLKSLKTQYIKENNGRTLFVIGSLNRVTREQLKKLLNSNYVKKCEVYPLRIIKGGNVKKEEINRVVKQVNKFDESYHTVIYTSNSKEDIDEALIYGEKYDLNSYEIGVTISKSLGEITSEVIKSNQDFNGLVITGGDTAVNVCEHLNARGLTLIDEISPAIPLGHIDGNQEYFTITKGGGIGDEDILLNAIKYFRGESINIK